MIIDCPGSLALPPSKRYSHVLAGQIELYTHVPLLPRLTSFLTSRLNIRLSAVYLLESQFMQDKPKFFAGVMSAMSCMMALGIGMICLMSKMDLVKDKKGRVGREVGRYVSGCLLMGQADVGIDIWIQTQDCCWRMQTNRRTPSFTRLTMLLYSSCVYCLRSRRSPLTFSD